MLPSVAISCHQLPSVAVWINNVTGSSQTAAGVVSRYQISYLIIWFRCLDHRPISHRTIGLPFDITQDYRGIFYLQFNVHTYDEVRSLAGLSPPPSIQYVLY